MRNTLLARLWVFGAVFCVWLSASSARSDDAGDIDRHVDTALEHFRAQIKDASELLAEAKGVLVIPDIKQAAFGVGGRWGEGALRVRNQTAGYYKLEAGSLGLRVGFKRADFIFLFMSDDALREFQASNGWTAGADVGATAGEASVGTSTDSLRKKHPVLGYALSEKGLMAGPTVVGSKFVRFHPEK
jgi:lipid-binding SYLF domain-containing protein